MKIGFIGGGNMAEALIGGIIRSELALPQDVIVSDIRPERLDYLEKTYSVRIANGNAEVVTSAATIILAVKPQNLEEISQQVDGVLKADQILISILAGKTRGSIRDALGKDVRVMRVMPNLPALVGCGISAIAETPKDREGETLTATILQTVGEVVIVAEEQMDAVTALSGSGPGFIYFLMEAFTEAGVQLGLQLQIAQKLSEQTFAGASALLSKEAATPAVLRERVTSPGGTTQAGLLALADSGLKGIIEHALQAACKRAVELSRPQAPEKGISRKE